VNFTTLRPMLATVLTLLLLQTPNPTTARPTTASPLLPSLPFSDQYARPRPRAAHLYNPVHFRPKPSTNFDIRPACHGLRG
jgi:hypothetical protein